jgi:hypothetical protein
MNFSGVNDNTKPPIFYDFGENTLKENTNAPKNDEDTFDEKSCNYFNASATVEMICALKAEVFRLNYI